MKNRNGLAVLGGVSRATGAAERKMALAMIENRRSRSGHSRQPIDVVLPARLYPRLVIKIDPYDDAGPTRSN